MNACFTPPQTSNIDADRKIGDEKRINSEVQRLIAENQQLKVILLYCWSPAGGTLIQVTQDLFVLLNPSIRLCEWCIFLN